MPTPWEDWKLDEDFFRAMICWNLTHPDRKLDRVLDNICLAIDSSKALFDVIPDNPFPARGLVLALAHLVKLGTTISKGKAEVQMFAKDTVRWVDQVRSAFQHGNADRFSLETWNNLEGTRAVINDICIWAYARLKDGRWKRLGHAFSIPNEINEFKSRLNEARNCFMHLSVINLSQGHDAIIRNIQTFTAQILEKQTEQNVLRDSIHSKLAEQKLVDAARQFVATTCSPRVAAKATYEGQGKTPCSPKTRPEILEDINTWVSDISGDAQRLLWLTGDPGAGKSSVTASVARQFNDASCLCAQFFINRSDARTTDPKHIFPSIAYQLANHSPEVALAINDALKEQRSLIDDISDIQAQKLFVEAIVVASSVNPLQPIIVVIDALDECDKTRLAQTAKIISKAIVDLPSNAKVLISSRPESAIQKRFLSIIDAELVKHIYLDTLAPTSIRDVKVFLVDKIQEIVEEYSLEDLGWPGEHGIQRLSDQASGLFIWAVTATSYIRAEIDAFGTERLPQLMDQLSVNGMDDINLLYSAVLEKTYTGRTDPWVFHIFRQIIGSIVVLQEPLCLVGLKDLLALRETETSEPVDVAHFVRQLRSVLVAGIDDISDRTVPRLHKSFFDFITSERADPRFRVNTVTSNELISMQCMRQLNSLRRDICDIEHLAASNDEISNLPALIDNCLPIHLRYACRFWSLHLPQTGVVGENLRELFRIFFYQHLLHWIEAMSLLGHVYSSAFLLLDKAEKWADYSCLCTVDVHLRTLINDAKRFIAMFSEPICKSAAHTYISALPFAPVTSSIYAQYRPTLDCSLDVLTGALQHWPAYSWIRSTRSEISCATLSPDGRQVVSGCVDGMVHVWDIATGQQVGSPLDANARWLQSVAISLDGKQIMAACTSGIVRFWDAVSGEPLKSLFAFHSGEVHSVAFSSDAKQIVSCLSDSTLVQDTASGQLLTPPLRHRVNTAKSVVLSPDGKRIVLYSDTTNSVVFVHVVSGQLTTCSLKGDTGPVTRLVFSPDGNQIVSASFNGTIRIWDSETGQPIGSPLYGHRLYVTSIVYSPDGKQFVSASGDRTVRVWNPLNGQPIGSPFEGHTAGVHLAAFSLDGRHIVSASNDKTIRLWNAVSNHLTAVETDMRRVKFVAISPDGRVIVSASLGGDLLFWDARGKQPFEPPFETPRSVRSAAFSSDSNRIVLATDDDICIRDMVNGQIIGSPLRSRVEYRSTGVSSGTMAPRPEASYRVWGAGAQCISHDLGLHNTHSVSVAFSQDGQSIICQSPDLVFNISTGTIIPGFDVCQARKEIFCVDGAWFCNANNRALLWWFPAETLPKFVWAYGGGKVAIWGTEGFVVIIDAPVLQLCAIP